MNVETCTRMFFGVATFKTDMGSVLQSSDVMPTPGNIAKGWSQTKYYLCRHFMLVLRTVNTYR